MNADVTTKRHFKIWPVLLLMLSTYLCTVTALIERSNRQAGSILPRTSISGSPVVKWRVVARGIIDKELERLERQRWDVATAKARMDEAAQWKQSLAENRLRNLVITYGLLQFPLGLLCLIAGFATVFVGEGNCNQKLVGCGAIGAGAVAVIALLARDYFGSLGW